MSTKNYIKTFLAANFELIADRITDNLQSDQREKFDELLGAYVDIFTKSVYRTTDYIYKHLKRNVNDTNLIVVSCDKGSCVVLTDKTDHQDKLQTMVEDGIESVIYKVAEDNILKDLELFKSFLDRNFRKYKHYDNQDNQPGQLYGTAKTHKFTNIDEITIDNLKFSPIIA